MGTVLIEKPAIDPRYAQFKLSIRESKIHRRGVYAGEAIPARRKVIEYTGERISRRETKRRGDGKVTYLFTLDDYWTLDGAFIIWWVSAPDTTLHSVAYMMMLITGIASLLINFNPLIKLDGYYMMSEALGLVDLKENSTAYVSAWVKRHIWHLPVEVPYVPRRWRFGYVAYALLSGLYSYTVLYVVARFVGNIFRNFDPDWSFIPELATAAIVFRSRIRTLVNFMKFVYLDKKDRVKAWSVSRHPVVPLGAAATLLFLPLFHESIQGRFILEPETTAIVRTLVPGTVTGVFVNEGMHVASGTPLFRLSNLPLQSKVGRSEADYAVASMHANSAVLHYSD